MTVLGGKKMELSAYRCESNLEVVQSCSCTLAVVLLHLSVQSIPGTGGDGEDDDLLFSDLTNLQCS